jgi:hypothetical protein
MNVQPVRIDRIGLVKISVPLETLTAARPGLEDLRLFDPDAREIPYLIERYVPSQRSVLAPKRFEATIQQDSTVLVLESGSTQIVSGVTLHSPALAFVKAARLEGSFDQAEWRSLAQGQPVFRQANGASLHLAIPPGRWAFLKVTLDDRRSAPVPFTGAVLHAEAGAPATSEPLGVTITQRTEEPGQSRLTLRFAGANVTLASLAIDTPEPLFTRAVSLAEAHYVDGEVRESVFVRDSVYRVAVEGVPGKEALSFGSETPLRSVEVSLLIQNDDNPPLPVARLQAARRPVYLTFNAAQAGSYRLLSGNAQCSAPRYDLAALRARLEELAPLPVTFGLLTTNPAYRPVDPLAWLRSEGTALDVADWRYRRSVHSGREGVQQVDLDLAVLAHASPSLQDLRLMKDGKQIPHVKERRPALRNFAPVLAKADDPKRPKVSRWEISLPYRSLPIGRLTASTPATYFRRDVRLIEERTDERSGKIPSAIASAVWSRSEGGRRIPLSLELASSPTTDRLFLEIENGDNPPLELQQVEAWHAVSRLLFASAQTSNVFLYYGNAKVGAPKYDLEMVGPKLLSAEKVAAELGREEALKPSPVEAREWSKAGWLFWLVLIGVVLGLLLVIARLLPKPE